MFFTLILFVAVGGFSKYESNTFGVVPGFRTIELCQKAGENSRSLVHGTKELSFTCVQMNN